MVADNLGLDFDDLGAEFDSNTDDDQGDDDREDGYVGPDDGDIDDGLGEQPERDQRRNDRRDQRRDRREHEPRRLDDLSLSSRDRRDGDTRPFAQNAEVRPDQNGNLVDPATGQIVARAGHEAALYQRAFKAGESKNAGGLQYRLRQRETQLRDAITAGRQLSEQVRQFQTQSEALKQFNITPEQQVSAFKLYNDLKRSPAQTLRALLTRAVADGMNVAELGIQGISGADAKGIMDLVREEINKLSGPLNEQRQQEEQQRQARQRQEEANRRVENEVIQFFEDNPEARRYSTVFERTLSNPEFSQMSLGEIWTRIQLNIERNRNKERNNNNRDARRNGRRFPRLSGRGGAPSGMRNDDSAPAPASTTYNTIINDILDQHPDIGRR